MPLSRLATLSILVFLVSCGAQQNRTPALGQAYVGPATLTLRQDLNPKSAVTAIVRHGDSPLAGRSTSRRSEDAGLFRLLNGDGAPQKESDTGRMLMEDAYMSQGGDLGRAVRLALEAIDFGADPIESRALASYLLVRAGRPADALRVADDGLALAPNRPDLRSNQAAARQMLGRAAEGPTR